MCNRRVNDGGLRLGHVPISVAQEREPGGTHRKDSSEDKVISPKQEVLLTGEGRMKARPSKHISSMLLVGGRGGGVVTQDPITFYYFRYLQQQTGILLQPWKSDDKNLTPKKVFFSFIF